MKWTIRFYRRMVAYREWQNQLAIHQSGRECWGLVQRAEQRYKELCK